MEYVKEISPNKLPGLYLLKTMNVNRTEIDKAIFKKLIDGYRNIYDINHNLFEIYKIICKS